MSASAGSASAASATATAAVAPERYPWRRAIATRWADNDMYGHVNNVVYYAWIDTLVNEHLIREGGLDPATATEIGVVVETGCRYRRSVAFPETVEAAMRVASIGRSSVVYDIAVFGSADAIAAATGRFVHVWVDRASRRPVGVPPRIRAALEALKG